jgi:fucose 4-O-acetylase-like acetyltransferase
MNFVGENSLAFFALHMMVQAVLIGVTVKVFQIDVERLHGSLVICILLTLITLLALVPVVLLINRYAAWLAGRRKISQ